MILLSAGLTATAAASLETAGKSLVKLFYVYSDKGAANSSFFVPSGWMGDYADIFYNAGSTDNPYAGSTCIKIVYNNRASSGNRWAGIIWQNPANNWGEQETGGVDLTGVSKLTFWARGEKGGETIKEFRIGGIAGEYGDSAKAWIGPVVLTNEWKKYSIDLSAKNLSRIIGGFAWSTNLDANPRGCTFYLDEIRYE